MSKEDAKSLDSHRNCSYFFIKQIIFNFFLDFFKSIYYLCMYASEISIAWRQ